ncbi:hypothetical protein D918_00908 [Trichuris suis]|nr:hypothetical protein D918_00908 [Trichuris suis]
MTTLFTSDKTVDFCYDSAHRCSTRKTEKTEATAQLKSRSAMNRSPNLCVKPTLYLHIIFVNFKVDHTFEFQQKEGTTLPVRLLCFGWEVLWVMSSSRVDTNRLEQSSGIISGP